MRGLTNRIGLPGAGLWLLVASLVTSIGNGMHTLAIGKLLYDGTGSVAAFGGVIIFEQVLSIIMQVVAGPWVDRGDPKRTCVRVELIRGALLVILASIMLSTEQYLFAWVLLMTLCIKVAHPFYRAAMFALAPAVVPDNSLARYNGYYNVGQQGGTLLGVALAGVVIDQWGATTAFLLNGLTFVFSALATMFVAAPWTAPAAAQAADKSAAWKQVFTGWQEIFVLIRREAGLGWHLLLNTVDNLAVILFNLMLVPIVAERYGGSAYWLSMVDGGFAVGAIATAAVVTLMTDRWGSRVSAVIGIGGQALCFLLLGLTQNGWLTVLLSFGIGAFNTISWTVLMTTLQLRVGKSVKGRIGTIRNLLSAAIAAVMVPIVSKMAELSLDWALVVSGGLCMVFALIALVRGRSRAAAVTLYGELPESAPSTAAGRG